MISIASPPSRVLRRCWKKQRSFSLLQTRHDRVAGSCFLQSETAMLARIIVQSVMFERSRSGSSDPLLFCCRPCPQSLPRLRPGAILRRKRCIGTGVEAWTLEVLTVSIIIRSFFGVSLFPHVRNSQPLSMPGDIGSGLV